jgi:archaellum biogenesis protein FlaJ (TadC family)
MMLESIKGFATSNFSWVVDKYPEFFATVRENLPKADMKIAHRTYVSLVVLLSVTMFILGLVVSFIALTMFETPLLMRIIYSFFASVLFAFTSFIVFIFYPMQRANVRKKDIEVNLPFVLTHMGAVAESGVPPYVIFKLISEFKEYGEISKETAKIVKNIDSFGMNPLTSIKEVAEHTPSDSFKQVLLGFVTTTEAGGNIKTFLKTIGDQALFEWRMKREKFLQQLSTLAEFYTGILIAAPLFIISLFAVMNMIQPTIAGLGILDLMKMSIYIAIPFINIAFLLFLSGVEVQI